MASLSSNPLGTEFEEVVAAHFLSRGFFVEVGIKDRQPDELLELDVVWTDYRPDVPLRVPIEVKSGDWGVGDVFRFLGWSGYLELEAGFFVHKEPMGRVDPRSIAHLEERTGVAFIHAPTVDILAQSLDQIGLAPPAWPGLPEIWRFSLWAQRRLVKSLGVAIKQGASVESAKEARTYWQLLNDTAFALPDVQDRIRELVDVHLKHRELAKSCSAQLDGKPFNLDAPENSPSFERALFQGKHYPVQACLYLSHSARLFILKSLVDLWIAKDQGRLRTSKIIFGEKEFDLGLLGITASMQSGMDRLFQARTFRHFPFFWQTFLWSWGGFYLESNRADEWTALSLETGVLLEEIPLALEAFDLLFPISGSWLTRPSNDSRMVLKLMPAALRGIGAFRRLQMQAMEDYRKLSVTSQTAYRMNSDHTSGALLLDLTESSLAS